MTFREGGPAEMKFDEPFDAVVGRFVLIFQNDPAATILAVGATCSAGEGGGLTVSVAVRVWVPWPVSELVKVMVNGP